MAFYSVAFLIFITVFIGLHELAGRLLPRRQWTVRLLAGVVFFGYISGVKIIFLLCSALSIWGGALLMSRSAPSDRKKRKRIRKAFTAAVVIFNLMLLILAKYLLPSAGFSFALPLGISYYTLQAVSYMVDVFRERYAPEKNPARLLLFLCWFPAMIQGPINRYDLIKDDLYKSYRLTAPEFRYAFYIFLFGAVKKYAIADLLAPMVNASLNDDSGLFPGSFLLFGALLYAIEQYADFSGGISMAMGVSLLFGVKMSENFRQPYFASSLAEFWRRWHITLGSWMKDYVFYPFAMAKPVMNMTKAVSKRYGNYAGRVITGGISNLLVFSLVGIWHGPEHHYLAWGLYNGVIIAVSDALAPFAARFNKFLGIREDGKPLHFFRVFRTFMIVVFAGYFDVINSVKLGIGCYYNTFAHFEPASGLRMIAGLFEDQVTSAEAVFTAAICILLLLINSICKERGRSPLKYICSRNFLVRWLFFFALTGLLLYSFAASPESRGFMYAAF